VTRRRVSDWIFLALWIITVLGAAGEHYIVRAQDKLAQDLARELDQAAAALDAGDWSSALETIRGARQTWEAARGPLALHTIHKQLDEISEALVEAEALLMVRSEDALGPLLVARERVKSLPERHRLSFRNLF